MAFDYSSTQDTVNSSEASIHIHKEVLALRQKRKLETLLQKVEETSGNTFFVNTGLFTKALKSYLEAAFQLNRQEQALCYLLQQIKTLSPTDLVREGLAELLQMWVEGKTIHLISNNTADLLLTSAQSQPGEFFDAPEIRYLFLSWLEKVGFICWERHEQELAHKLLIERSHHVPRISEVWRILGSIEQARGNYDTARKIFDEGTHLDSTHAPTWHSWAMMEQQLGDTRMANVLFFNATLANPQSPAIWAAWARMEFLEGHIQVGRTKFEEAIQREKKPQGKLLWRNHWAVVEMQEGDNVFAWKQVNLILSEKSNYRPALRTAGTLCYREQRFEEAENFLNRSLYPNTTLETHKRHNAGVNLTRINNFWLWKHFDEALSLCRQGLAEGGSAAAQFQRRHELAVMLSLYAQGKEAEALDQYQAILQGFEDEAEEYNQLANALTKMAHFDLAELHYRNAIELAPLEAKFYYNLGSLLEETDRTKEALYCYKIAHALAPNFFWAGQSIEKLHKAHIHPQAYVLPNTRLMKLKILEAAAGKSYRQQCRALEIGTIVELDDITSIALQLLSSDSGEVRHAATKALTHMRPLNAIEPLLALGRKEDKKQVATHLLKQIVVPERLDSLLDFFQRANPRTRQGLAEIILNWDPDKSVNAFLQLLEKVDRSSYGTICSYLSHFADDDTIDLLVNALSYPNTYVRQALVMLLARLKPASAINPLRRLLKNSRDPDVLRKVTWLLYQINS